MLRSRPAESCPVCFDVIDDWRTATVFECDHALCATCAEAMGRVEAADRIGTRSGIIVSCPLCRKAAKVAYSSPGP